MRGRLGAAFRLVGNRCKELMQRVGDVWRNDREHAYLLWGGFPLALVNMSVVILGGLISVFARDWIYRLISEREARHVV